MFYSVVRHHRGGAKLYYTLISSYSCNDAAYLTHPFILEALAYELGFKI